MADTYSINVNAHTLAANRIHLSILNGAGSGKTMKIVVAESYVRNTAAVVGIHVCWELIRITGHSGGTPLTPDKYDTTSPNVPAEVVCLDLPAGATEVGNALAAGNTYTEEAANMQPQVNFYENDGSTIRKQIICHEGEGIELKQGPFGTVGIVGFKLTFTLE